MNGTLRGGTWVVGLSIFCCRHWPLYADAVAGCAVQSAMTNLSAGEVQAERRPRLQVRTACYGYLAQW
jgi:hypothetical protein